MDSVGQYAPQHSTSTQPSMITHASERTVMGPPLLRRYSSTTYYPVTTSTSATDYGNSYGFEQSPLVHPSRDSIQSSGQQHISHQAQSQRQHTLFRQDSALPRIQQQLMYEQEVQYTQSQAGPMQMMAAPYTISSYPQQHGQPSNMDANSYISNQTAPNIGSYSTISLPATRLRSPFVEASSSFRPHDGTYAEEQEVVNSRTQLEQEKTQYTYQVRSACESILAGRVTEAKDKVLTATQWLVASVVPLGLIFDDEHSYHERLAMWRELNYCWRALGRKQMDITARALNSGQQPSDILTAASIHSLINDLLALGDQLEPHGLIDYEMGLEEDAIEAIFEACLDILPQA